MIIYYGPVGANVENPSEEFVRELIFNKKEEYWKQGSGDSCFEVEDCQERLVFFYDEPYGFLIIRHPDYLVPIDRTIKINTIEHKVGGEPMKIPTCSYVNRETAYEVIQHFIMTKEVPAIVEWIDLYDIEFDHDFY